ncbi:YitT family protein [Thalassococcus sp. BH17M4-6]|uniref:YitT family protein n=1 Tax=Thalassococcus sp. BH17M4-6 TaxID=3413148 RepID=UPI003BD38210
MLLLDTPPPDRHTLAEDIQGILIGTTLVALSIQFLRASELFTGQIAGLALITTYPTGWPFGVVFFVMNLPFYFLAIHQLGWRFTIKNFIAVTLMSVMAELMPLALTIGDLHPGMGAALFGILAGMGLLSLFRHGATLGGVGIVALWLQDRGVLKAGNTQLMFDAVVFALALLLFPADVVGWSLLGAVILNVIITVNHRRDRYIAKS